MDTAAAPAIRACRPHGRSKGGNAPWLQAPRRLAAACGVFRHPRLALGMQRARRATRLLAACLALAGLPAGLAAATPAPPAELSDSLTVAAAANLASVGPALAQAFAERHPRISLKWVYGASGSLLTQIKHGAPYQVFLSADSEFPQAVQEAGLALEPPRVYALGHLVLLSATPRDFSAGLALLAQAEDKQFALANPELAPYGAAARSALQAAGLWDKLKSKAVYAQSISQAVQYSLNGTGLGLVNRSALFSPDLGALATEEGRRWIAVPPGLYSPIQQAFVLVKPARGGQAGSSPAQAAFAAFLLSAPAQALLAAHGYGAAPAGRP